MNHRRFVEIHGCLKLPSKRLQGIRNRPERDKTNRFAVLVCTSSIFVGTTICNRDHATLTCRRKDCIIKMCIVKIKSGTHLYSTIILKTTLRKFTGIFFVLFFTMKFANTYQFGIHSSLTRRLDSFCKERCQETILGFEKRSAFIKFRLHVQFGSHQ